MLDIRDAAELLGVAVDTMYVYAKDGLVPAFKLGNRWRFRRVLLEEWMDEQSGVWKGRDDGR